MTSFKMHPMVGVFGLVLIYITLSFCVVDASIEIYDRFGRKIDAFQDREAAFDDDFGTMDGYLVSADPQDACTAIAPPTFLTNFTVGKFVIINGTEVCNFNTKVRNSEKAGYDVAIIFDPSAMPFEVLHSAFPKFETDIQVIFVSFEDGIILRNNYLYNNSYHYNYRVRIRPNTPDLTYYMYLFGAVIGICFFVMLLFMMCLLIKCIQERRKLRRNRLSRRQIKQIPTAKFSKGDQYDVCAICLENYNEGDKLRLLPCSHAYHCKCIDPWLMNNRRNCPLCKRKITFGDSGDESDSEDSELTSPAENTPLLTSPSTRTASWGTFAATAPSQPDNSGPSSLPNPFQYQSPPHSDVSSENPFLSDDETEALLPPPHHSVNHSDSALLLPKPEVQTVVVVPPRSGTTDDSAQDGRGLIV